MAIFELYRGVFQNELGQYSLESFSIAIDRWKEILTDPRAISDHERSLVHMDIAVEYFAILSQWVNRIKVLQLELRLVQSYRAYADVASSMCECQINLDQKIALYIP